MTPSQLKQELYRSATEDEIPHYMSPHAFHFGCLQMPPGAVWSDLMPWGVEDEPWRTYALLLAESIE